MVSCGVFLMIKPIKTLDNDFGQWNRYSAEDLGLTVITYLDNKTNVVLAEIFSNPEKRVASHIAWAGARHSRAPGDTIDILVDMGEKGVDPDEKLESTFKGYGHSSVADMARFAIQFNNVPMHVPMHLFNDTYINSGQEKSTRFQKQFSGVIMHPLTLYLNEDVRKESFVDELNKDFESLGVLSLENFNSLKPKITEAYEKFFKPVSTADRSALNTRVLDTVRFNLLLGQSSGFALETSARDWSKIISHLKASQMEYYNNLGLQLENFLAPSSEIEKYLEFKAEAPSLIKHKLPDNTLKNNIPKIIEFYNNNIGGNIDKRSFKGFKHQEAQIMLTNDDYLFFDNNNYHRVNITSGTKMAAQYILNIMPVEDRDRLFYDLDSLPIDKKKELSSIIFNGHDQYNELPPQFASSSDITVVFDGTLGELRDFNRHRAWGRFLEDIPIYYGGDTGYDKALAIMNKGFGLPLYMNIPEFREQRQEMMDRLNRYYDEAFKFMEKSHRLLGDVSNDYFINILPLAARSSIWMHGNPKQADYLANLRVRPGGHINYRVLAFDAAKKLSESDPFLAGLELPRARPDPADREEFFNRS